MSDENGATLSSWQWDIINGTFCDGAVINTGFRVEITKGTITAYDPINPIIQWVSFPDDPSTSEDDNGKRINDE